MTDIVANFELQEEPQISANFELQEEPQIPADFTLTGGTIYHDQLLHRDYSNQHPISAITDLQNSLDTLQTNIDDEASTRETADNTLDTKIDNLGTAVEGDIQAEVTAREQADTRLEGLISDEETRATAAEESLSDDISAENTRALNAEETLQDNIDAEETRAKSAEQDLSDDISSEAGTRASEITRVEGLITAEETARISADNTLQGNINNEKTARENADSALQSNIDAEVLARGNADTALNTKIDNHIADKANPHQVTKAQVGLGNVDNTADIDKPISTAVSAAFDAVEAEITDINNLIPNEASSSNKLADKEFVNSSIATNTADFIGTFASVSDLESYSGTVTNNDYAFVVNRVVTDNGNDWATITALNAYDKTLLSNFDYAWVINGSNFDLYRFDILTQVWELRASNIEKSSVTLNSAYNRYKAVVSGSIVWTYEYTLNNSSFTASQWQAINSGATDALIEQITTNQGNITTIQTTMSGYGNIVTHNVSEFATAAQGEKADTAVQPADLAAVATSGSYNDLDDKPTIGNATLTIQKNGTAVDTFTANATADKAINITVPTDTSDLTNGAGYITGITSSDVTTALGYTPYNSSNPSGYQTASDVQTAIVGKQDTLVSGTNIKTINNNSILGSGNLNIDGLPSQTGQNGKFLSTDGTNPIWQNVDALPSQTGQAGKYLTTDGTNPSWNTITIPSVDVDSISINRNASDELQTIGVINQNDTTTAIKTWTGTKAQYDAIVSKDPNTLYEVAGYGVFLGTTQIAAGSAELNNPFTLFEYQFSDHILNNASWLRADTFSWQSGSVYVSAYEHLVADIDGITAETEIIGSNTITFYRATDGHKICLADQENIVTAIYADKGVAWYYILDTANTRFKLPRTKFGVTGLRGTVGDYVAAGLPNITGTFTGGRPNASPTGAFSTPSAVSTVASGTANCRVYSLDASNSSSIYGNSTTVQPRATEMYLYFYVGETIQDATLIDVGVITDTLNGKADVDLSNCTKPHIVETYDNGTSWYMVYSNGWCEQGGYFICTSSRNDQKIDLLKNYSSTDYGVQISTSAENATASTSNATYVALSRYIGLQVNSTKTTSAFYMQVVNGLNYTWEAKGYIN